MIKNPVEAELDGDTTLEYKINYYCNKCKKGISEKEFRYSINQYKKVLCKYCQNFNDDKSTLLARKLYEALKKQKVEAKLELYDGHKHIDIAIPKAKVNIEVDGGQHNYDHKQALSDLKRTYYSFKKGYLTLRIPNSLLLNNFEETVNYIVKLLNESVKQLEEDDDFFSFLKF
ncbi:MAG: DUF559 domain-containing protein [Nanoarchaeota archaeon]